MRFLGPSFRVSDKNPPPLPLINHRTRDLMKALDKSNHSPPTLTYFNCHPLEVVSRYRGPQLQVGENCSYLFILGPNICKSWCLTLSSLNLTLSSHPLQAANCCRNSRLVVDADDSGWKIKVNCLVLVKQFQGNCHHKHPSCRNIKSDFRDVKWCCNASWGLKGLNTPFILNISDFISW